MIRWRNLDDPYSDRLASVRTRAPHDILGVPVDCTKAQARRAYLALVKTYHPDHADPFMAAYNQEMLKLVNQAYAYVSKRAV
ncbi:DnaJ domain-containing protein [Sphingobium sp. AP50]|uniref:J domain-containing protein n=1 Tax=Sphingobium sp. AP50 TaxID=1884369 RepID=UPI0008B886F5|nr:J domain-containing protein [Sphingobium sp. AP50]SEJ85330.1 DnaJ domain-containing protein [Sphingobium sp. AP50]